MHCPSCYKPVTEDDVNCPHCGTSLSLFHAPNANPARVTEKNVTYAGFWKRFAARLVDSLILGLITFVIAALAGVALGLSGALPQEGTPQALMFEAGMNLLGLVAGLFYYALQESSVYRATWGKRALGIEVTDLQLERISLGRAMGRYVATALCYLTLFIGFIMAGFTARKQALHDMAAGTLVINRPGSGSKTGCVIAAVVVFFVGVALIGVLAAIAIPAYQDYVKKAEEAKAAMEAEAYGNVDPVDESMPQDPPPADDTALAVADQAQRAAAALEAFVAANGGLPASMDDIPEADGGPEAPLVSMNEETAELTVMSRDAAHVLVLTPVTDENGALAWRCRSETILPRDHPPACNPW